MQTAQTASPLSPSIRQERENVMEIDYYDEDFCKDDLDETDDLDELESMEVNLLCEIGNSKERIDIYEANVKTIQSRISEVKNET